MKRNGEQLYYPQSGTEGCRAATIHNVPDPLCILDEKSCSEHVTFSFFAYYINRSLKSADNFSMVYFCRPLRHVCLFLAIKACNPTGHKPVPPYPVRSRGLD